MNYDTSLVSLQAAARMADAATRLLQLQAALTLVRAARACHPQAQYARLEPARGGRLTLTGLLDDNRQRLEVSTGHATAEIAAALCHLPDEGWWVDVLAIDDGFCTIMSFEQAELEAHSRRSATQGASA